LLNALTVDVEDYYHATSFAPYLSDKEWSYLPSRIEGNVMRILEILDAYGVKATFFVLGWIAKRHPSLIRAIHSAGHEIACHGYSHRLVYRTTPEEFRLDLKQAKSIIEDSIGSNINGFRATSYSFVKTTLWALDILIEEGFLYDSSIFPIHHDRYGIPYWHRFPHIISRSAGYIFELPPSTLRVFKNNIPIAGGAYLRFIPLSIITWGIKRINKTESKPAVIYLHPWEIDGRQPRFKVRRLTGLRHYTGLDGVEDKLIKILQKFEFGSISDVINKSDCFSLKPHIP